MDTISSLQIERLKFVPQLPEIFHTSGATVESVDKQILSPAKDESSIHWRIPQELVEKEWFIEADVTRFIAKFIHTFNRDASITKLLDSTSKINKLLGRRRAAAGDAAARSRQKAEAAELPLSF